MRADEYEPARAPFGAARVTEQPQWKLHLDDFVICVRPLQGDAEITELTALLHRAYRQLADLGFRYVASFQDETVTRSRAAKGTCLVATLEERLLGTITLYGATQTHGCPWYDRGDVGHFGQFAVDPELQGCGLGGGLLRVVEGIAVETGLRELALNTAEGADHLIRWYEHRGYRFIQRVDWGVNYTSVILSKSLGPPAVAPSGSLLSTE